MKKAIHILAILLVPHSFLFFHLTISIDQVLADNVNKEEKPIGVNDFEELVLRSVELNPNDNPDEVISLLEPYKDNDNNKNPYFYNNLGLAYKCKGRFEDAIAAYSHSLALKPEDPATQCNIAIAYIKNNELSNALKFFLKSAGQRSGHTVTKLWIDYLSTKLDVFNVPDVSKLKLVFDKKMNIDRQKPDRESRLRIYLTHNEGRIQVLSVGKKVYSYGIDSDTVKPVDYVIIDNDGDGQFEKIINSENKFEVPSWAYNPD